MIDFFNQIEDYKQNRLSDDHQILFEEEMAKNATLKDAVANHSIVMEALDLLLEDSIRSEIKSLEAENLISNQRSTRSFKSSLSLILALIILISSWLYFILQVSKNKRRNYEDLYATHFIEFIPSRTRGPSGVLSFDGSVNMVDTGHRLMSEGQIQLARIQFEKILEDTPGIGREKAEWLLSLCYLYEGESVKADSLLSVILANENHTYFPNAADLKKDLD